MTERRLGNEKPNKLSRLRRHVTVAVFAAFALLSAPGAASAEGLSINEAAHLCPKGPDVAAQFIAKLPDDTLTDNIQIFKTGGECVGLVKRLQDEGIVIYEITPVEFNSSSTASSQ